MFPSLLAELQPETVLDVELQGACVITLIV